MYWLALPPTWPSALIKLHCVACSPLPKDIEWHRKEIEKWSGAIWHYLVLVSYGQGLLALGAGQGYAGLRRVHGRLLF